MEINIPHISHAILNLPYTYNIIDPIDNSITSPVYMYPPRFKGPLARFCLALLGRRCFVRDDERRPYIYREREMHGGRHSYSWRWNRESKQAESIGLIKLLSSWKTRWAAVALALSLPLLLCRHLISLPYPRIAKPRNRLSSTTSPWLRPGLVRIRPQPRQPRQSRCGRAWNSLLTTDL